MRLLEAATVSIPENRQRRELDEVALSELAEDIAIRGLLHAIVIRDGDILVAGERRLRAVLQLGDLALGYKYNNQSVNAGFIPTVTLGELSELEAREAEYSENTVRRDLTWAEQAQAYANLHELRQSQSQGFWDKQTITKTATEILGAPATGAQVDAVSKSIIIAKHLDNPEVAGAKNAKEAYKIIQRQATAKQNVEKALEVGKTATTSRHNLLNGDAIELLAEYSDHLFDVVVTDPPYGIDADSFGDQAGIPHEYEDSEAYWRDVMLGFAQQSFRVCKEAAHAYVFCDPRRFDTLYEMMDSYGWLVWPIPIIWNKGTGMLPQPFHAPRRTYECILFARKGDKRVTAVYNDVITISPDAQPVHPAQKPADLYCNLLKRSCAPGDHVLDPFCGRGTIFIAANRLSLYATGIEKSPATYGLALKSLEQKD